MGHDDREVGKIGGDVVDAGDGRSVLELQPSPAGSPAPAAPKPLWNSTGNAERAARRVQRVEARVVGEEGLVYRMQLQALQTEIADRALQLVDGPVLPRIDGRETR